MKYIPVGGGLDYDNPNVNVSLGDGRLRSDVEVTADGVAVTVKDMVLYEETGDHGLFGVIQFIVSDGNDVFLLDRVAGSDSYRLFRQRVAGNVIYDLIAYIPVSTNIIYDNTKIDVKASNGKIFISEEDREPVYIDTANLLTGNSYNAVMYGSSFRIDGSTQVFQVGDIVCIVSKVSDNAKPWCVLGTTQVSNVESFSGYYRYSILHGVYENGLSGNVEVFKVNTLTDVKQPLHKDYLKLARPVPFLQPEVRMVEDASVSVNEFLNKLYSYAYTYVYWDGYETPLSPMTTPNLDQYEGYVYGANINKAEVSVKSLPGVSKIRLYCKGSFGSDWVMVDERDATALTNFNFYGVASGVVMDNTLVKFGENIPFSTKGLYIDTNRLLLYGYRNEIDGAREIVSAKVESSGERHSVESPSTTNYNLSVNSSFEISRILTFEFYMGGVDELTGKKGRLRFYFHANYILNAPLENQYLDYIRCDVVVYFDNNRNDDVFSLLAAEVERHIQTYLPYYSISATYDNTTHEIIIEKTLLEDYYQEYQLGNKQATLNVISGGFSVFRYTLKPGAVYNFGVGIYDTYGRFAGFKEMPALTVGENTSLTDEVEVISPSFTVNTDMADGSRWYYQFFVRRRLEDRRQFVVRGRGVDTQEQRIKRVYDYIYIKINDLVSDAGDSIMYTYQEGDLVRFYCYYDTNNERHIVPTTEKGGKIYRIEGVVTDGGIEYIKIRYPNEDTSSPNSIYEQEGVKYFQFEIIRNRETGNILWQAIGGRYPLSVYNNMPITVSWGDYVIRPYVPYSETSMSSMVIVHSQTVSESNDSPMLFNPERAIIPFDVDTQWKNGIFYSRPYISNIRSNGFVQFDYEAFVDFNSSYGQIINIARLGNRLFVFFESGIGVANIDSTEVTTPDDVSQVYSYKYIGRMNYEPNVCLKNKYCLAETPSNLYMVDGRANALKIISLNGIYDVSGEQSHPNGVHVGKFRSIMANIGSIFYDPIRKRLFLVGNGVAYVYNDVSNRLESVRSIEDDGFSNRYLFVNVPKGKPGVYIWSNEYTNYCHMLSYGSGNGNYYDGEVSMNVSRYDIYIPVGIDADFLSLVIYANKLPVLDVQVYAYGDNSYIYTSIPLSHFVRYENGWRADIPKGVRNTTSITSPMLYEGEDLVGRTARVVIYFEGELYGIGINFVKRKY